VTFVNLTIEEGTEARAATNNFYLGHVSPTIGRLVTTLCWVS